MTVRFDATRLFWIAWIVLANLLLIGPALADKRVALVIGNAAYRNVPKLTNPTNDAGDMARALERLGFSVQTINDATYDNMRRGLLEFGRQVRGADVAVVYFAGHGIEVGGENWLIPIDAELRSDVDVDHEAMGLRSILPAIENASKLGLVILDACRNNPFAGKMLRSTRTRAVSRGLASVEPTGNVLVAYSAKDGTVAADGDGRNSPFTSSLLKHIETPGLEINFLFRNVRDDVIRSTRREQQPFVYGSLSREAIYLKAAPPPVVAVPQPPMPSADEITWSFLKDTSDPAALKRFVEQFPVSPRRPEAERRIAVLMAEQSAAARALEQRMAALAAEAQAAKTQSAGSAPEDVAWGLVKDSKDPDQFRLFLDQFPNSARRAEAQQRMAAITSEQRTAATALEQRMAALTKDAERPPVMSAPPIAPGEIARSLQLELKRVGCFDGAVNGQFGTSTRNALRNFGKLAAVTVPADELSVETLRIIRGIDKRVCPLNCKSGERADGERCIQIVCPAGQVLRDGACAAKPEPKKRVTETPASRSNAPAASGGGGGSKCFMFQGRRFCE